MRLFSCPRCGARLHFDNDVCLSCGSQVALDPVRLGFVLPESGAHRRCANHAGCGCNWIVTGDSPELCLACGLNRTIPPIADPVQRRRWVETERAKKRLVYDLLRLGLAPSPVAGPDDPLTFDILISAEHGGSGKVVMGHAEGHVTIDATEADAAMREERREMLGEAYRTMLGHMRHECGHYVWDRLAALPDFSDAFRSLFGDERADYGEALKTYYASGARHDWQESHISEYATAHPWEDWAETFAHYLHMRDGLETAANARLPSLGMPDGAGAQAETDDRASLERSINQWVEFSIFMNSMNRGLGHRDFYPFVVSAPVREKLAFTDRWLKILAGTQRPAA